MNKSGVIVVIGAMFLLVVGAWTPEQRTAVIAAETSPAPFSTPQSYTGSVKLPQMPREILPVVGTFASRAGHAAVYR